VRFSPTENEVLKIEELKELLELVSERNIAELEIENEGVKIRIRKEIARAEPSSAPPAGTAAVSVPEAPAVTAGEPAAAKAEAADNGLLYVTSPMVGTFYRQAEPGSEPYTREGDYVRKGQVLCIIEAMKLMNEIECEYEGQLVKVLVENGRPVQYGDPLFAIRSV
jgi:acetyl-CoA carboxylase biotin carboxyl carrier protein